MWQGQRNRGFLLPIILKFNTHVLQLLPSWVMPFETFEVFLLKSCSIMIQKMQIAIAGFIGQYPHQRCLFLIFDHLIMPSKFVCRGIVPMWKIAGVFLMDLWSSASGFHWCYRYWNIFEMFWNGESPKWVLVFTVALKREVEEYVSNVII